MWMLLPVNCLAWSRRRGQICREIIITITIIIIIIIVIIIIIIILIVTLLGVGDIKVIFSITINF